MDSSIYYNTNASGFIEETLNADMSSLHSRFTRHLANGGYLLDAGCGSGRDSFAFIKSGYKVDAFDASIEMVKHAAALTGLPVILSTFEDFKSDKLYDGIWACASLLHVPMAELPSVMKKLASFLKPGGAWYLSFKYGAAERIKDGRKFTDLNESSLQRITESIPGIRIESTWVTEDARPGRSDRWLNALLVKE